MPYEYWWGESVELCHSSVTVTQWTVVNEVGRAAPSTTCEDHLGLTTPMLWRTRKPCYRKDDRAMRPIYECPEKFRESLATATATFPEIVNGLLLWSIVWKCVRNLKFVALAVPDIIGVLKNFGSPWIRPRSLFSKILTDGPFKCTGQTWSP